MTERPLRDWEIAEARLVFADSLDYARVRVHEGATWTDIANQLGIWLKHIEPTPLTSHNAITIGYHCYFPVELPQTLDAWDQSYKFGWLIHELTHAWQFQHIGWKYLPLALAAQFRLREKAYDFGGVAGLIAAQSAGENFLSFNPEQQGDIARWYYNNQRVGDDASAWIPFIQEIQNRE